MVCCLVGFSYLILNLRVYINAYFKYTEIEVCGLFHKLGALQLWYFTNFCCKEAHCSCYIMLVSKRLSDLNCCMRVGVLCVSHRQRKCFAPRRAGNTACDKCKIQ